MFRHFIALGRLDKPGQSAPGLPTPSSNRALGHLSNALSVAASSLAGIGVLGFALGASVILAQSTVYR